MLSVNMYKTQIKTSCRISRSPIFFVAVSLLVAVAFDVELPLGEQLAATFAVTVGGDDTATPLRGGLCHGLLVAVVAAFAAFPPALLPVVFNGAWAERDRRVGGRPCVGAWW